MDTTSDEQPQRELLTAQEAARWLRVSASTLRRWVRQGLLVSIRIPAGRRAHRTVRYRLEDLRRLVNSSVHVDRGARAGEAEAGMAS
ncbi:MAG: helix-turn-helix domain-containing protein [Planctomycetes bacterium]|nr:helix-turn-helix domain-containing protein [Planctomycetota bacterium]